MSSKTAYVFAATSGSGSTSSAISVYTASSGYDDYVSLTASMSWEWTIDTANQKSYLSLSITPSWSAVSGTDPSTLSMSATCNGVTNSGVFKKNTKTTISFFFDIGSCTSSAYTVSFSAWYVSGRPTTGYLSGSPTPPAAIKVIYNDSMTLDAENTISITSIGYIWRYTVDAYSESGTKIVSVHDSSSSATISFTPTSDNFGQYISTPNSDNTSFTGSFYLAVWVKGNTVQTSKNIAFSITLDNSQGQLVPDLALTVTDSTTNYSTYGKYVVGQSKLFVTADSTMKRGAIETSISTSANGSYYTAKTFTTDTVASTSYNSVSSAVEDSRGLSKTVTQSIQILDWHSPRLSTATVHRVTYNSSTKTYVEDDEGAYVRIDWKADVSPLDNKNSVSLSITAPDGTHSITPSSYTASGNVISAADIEHTYNITWTITDNFSSTTYETTLSTAGCVMDLLSGGKGVGIGKIAELTKYLDLASDWTFRCYNAYIGDKTLSAYIKQEAGSDEELKQRVTAIENQESYWNSKSPTTLVSTSAPTTSTVGELYQLYFDKTNITLYICTAIGSSYTWEKIGGATPKISFQINGSTFYADQEMTWSAWCSSPYNTKGYTYLYANSGNQASYTYWLVDQNNVRVAMITTGTTCPSNGRNYTNHINTFYINGTAKYVCDATITDSTQLTWSRWVNDKYFNTNNYQLVSYSSGNYCLSTTSSKDNAVCLVGSSSGTVTVGHNYTMSG